MPWIALSYEHGDLELEITLEATRKALTVYRKALEDGANNYLIGPAIKPVFRKNN
jgi:glutamate-1-semialdehyde 2,1-aminomutase